MRAVPHADARRVRVDRHLQVVRGVADHHRARKVLPEFAREFVQHGGMRLGEGFVGATRAVERAREPHFVERAIQADAALAGRDREEITLLAQFLQQLAHAGEQFGLFWPIVRKWKR